MVQSILEESYCDMGVCTQSCTVGIAVQGQHHCGRVVKGQQVSVFNQPSFVYVWGAILGNMNKEHESNKGDPGYPVLYMKCCYLHTCMWLC